MKKHYINAVVDLLQKGRNVDAVLAQLTVVLAKKGHIKLHAEILKGVLAKLSLQKSTTTSVVVAKEADSVHLQSAIAEALSSLGGDSKDATVTVDQTLIGGFIASHKGKLINRSYKEKLVSLYRSITK